MAQYLSPIGNDQVVASSTGIPLVGGYWEAFLAGTSTPVTTYTSNTGGTPQAAQIVLDASGRPANPIWITGGVPVKFRLSSAAAAVLLTIDNVSGINDPAGITSQDQWVLYGAAPTRLSATSFSVVGDQTGTFQIGRRLKSTNSGGTIYSSITNSVFGAVTTVTVVNDSGTLDAGMSAVSYGILSATNQSIPSVLTALASINGGPIAGFRNIVIDGGFTVNQRAYVSAAVLASGSYGHDRWKGGASGGDYSFTQLESDTTITIAANKTLIQVIENKSVQATSYVLSWTGTVQARYAVNSATPAGSYASSPILITGQTVGTVMSIEFGNGASTGTLGKVQLERGTAAAQATSFEQRPWSNELTLCQRYFEKSYSQADALGANTASGATYWWNAQTGSSAALQVPFKVSKRTTPTIAQYSSTGSAAGNIRNITGGADVTATTTGIGESGYVMQTNAAGALAFYSGHWTASAEL